MRTSNQTKLLILLPVLLFLAPNFYGQTSPLLLARFVDGYSKKHNFSGTILIQKNSKTGYAKSFGLANRQHRVLNRMETRYKVASITKAFTSVLILLLVEQSKLDLDKTIGTYLPDYKCEARDKVTIRHLLNHTSGMTNTDRVPSLEYVVKNGFPLYQLPHTSDQILEIYCREKPAAEPGTKFDYNNGDYIVLGKIIERLYGKTYEQALREMILEPLHMRDSGILRQPEIVENLADTYFYRDEKKKLTNDLPIYTENFYAAAGMYSTAADVRKFAHALFGGKLLKRESLDRMFASGLDEYGYGVWVYDDYDIGGKKYKIVKRPGSTMGANAMLFHVLEANATIIILSNTNATDLNVFAAEIAKRAI